MKIFQVDVPIFLTSVVCCHSCTKKEAEDALYDYQKKRNRVQFDPSPTTRGGVRTYNGDVYMWVEDPHRHYSDVFHELVHVIDAICELKGMAIDEELRAYFMGWFKINLADKITSQLEKQYKKRKREKKRIKNERKISSSSR